MPALILLVVALLSPSRAHAQGDTGFLVPDTVVQAPSGPRIVILKADRGGVAALRLFVPLIEGPAEAGVGRILVTLALERMAGPAGQVGARVSSERTPWGIAYTAAGAEVDLEYLTYLLRRAAERPQPETVALDRARGALQAEIERISETPAERLLYEVGRSAAPHLPPATGSPTTLGMIGSARLQEVWARSHNPSEMSIVAWTTSDPEVLHAMLGSLGAPETTSSAPLDAPDPGSALAQAPPRLRSWYAQAQIDTSTSDPHAAVAAHMIARALQESAAEFQASVRLWQLRDRTLLVVSGSAGRGRGPRMRAAISSVVDQVRDGLDAASVAASVSEVAWRYRLEARNPQGLVGVIGRALEATGQPTGAESYLSRLSAISVTSLATYLGSLSDPLTTELLP